VTRYTVKEAFSGKYREKVRKSLTRASILKVDSETRLSSGEIELSLKRGPYFKKLRNQRRLLSLLRKYPLPQVFSRQNRRILRGVYYCIPVLRRLLVYPPDQLMLAEVDDMLYHWLLLANITRGSTATINRWYQLTNEEFSNPQMCHLVGQALMSQASDRIIPHSYSMDGESQGSC